MGLYQSNIGTPNTLTKTNPNLAKLKSTGSGILSGLANGVKAIGSGISNLANTAPNTGFNPNTSGGVSYTPAGNAVLQSATPQTGVLNQSQAPQQSQAPAPAVKKTTVTEYHPPATNSGVLGNNQVNIGTESTPNIKTNGVLNSQSGTPQGSTGVQTGAMQNSNPNVTQVNPQQNSLQTATQRVLNAGSASPEAQYYNNMAISAKELSNHNALDPYAEQGFYNGTKGAQLGVSLNAPDLQGRAAGEAGLSSGVGNIFGSAAGVGYANALQQQQLGLSAAENVLGASQPVTQFGQLTDPLTGKVIGADSTGNNPLLNNAVSQAVQLVKNGADPQGSAVQNLLSGFGQLGQTAFTQAQQQVSNGTYNPTATSAQVQQNISQGQAYQGQATQVDTALKSVDAITGNVIDLLNKSGYNPTDSAIYNKPINQYIASLGNSAAAKQVALYMGDIQKYTGQILATNSGTIPTDVSNTLANIDPSTLNGKQLANYLETVNYLGTTQRNVLQQQATSSYGQGGGYAGTQGVANAPAVGTANTSMGSGVTDPTKQGLAGVGLNVASDIGKIVTSGSNILSFILGKVGL